MRLPTMARPSCVFDGQAGFFVVHGLSAYYADHGVSPILSYARRPDDERGHEGISAVVQADGKPRR